ncbi:hypothetical protein AAVH_43330, partial [Aphelenchoides avenae]
LETLRYVVPLHKPRKHTDNTSVDLAADIVKLNASSIKELDSMPMWKLSEPLPALRLRLFSYEPWPGAADDDLANLSGCVVEELRFNLEHYPWERVTLEVLAEVNVKKIVFQGDTTAFSWLSASEGTTNEHRSWTAENVREEYDCVQDVRDAIAQMPPELHVCASVDAKFHRVGDAETKEAAHKLASELGFGSETFVMPCGSGVEYDYKVELSPASELRVHWIVYDQAR